MYKRSGLVQVDGSASYLHNNLTICNMGKDVVAIAIVCRNYVNLAVIDQENNILNSRQIISRISKDGSHAATGDTDECPTLIQVKFIEVSNRIILVICTNKCIYFYESDGKNLIFFHSLNSLKASTAEGTTYARGVTCLKPNLVMIGTSSGSVLVFEVPHKGSNVQLVAQLQEKGLNYGITDVITNEEGSFLCAGDSKGNLGVWSIKSPSDMPKLSYILHDCMGFACTSLAIYKSYLIVAYGNGVISIFNLYNGRRLADINAHGRWINSISIDHNILASVGDDCYLRLWQFNEINAKFEIKLVQAEHVADSLLVGVQFVGFEENKRSSKPKLYFSTYDSFEIGHYIKA